MRFVKLRQNTLIARCICDACNHFGDHKFSVWPARR